MAPNFARARGRPRATVAAALVLAGALAAPPWGAQAQVELPIDPLAGRYQRDLRRIQGQAASDPAGAARQAAQARRQLIDENGGVDLPPERARIERELGRIEAIAPPPAAAAPAPADPVPRSDLPSSYGDEADGLPSIQREFRLVSRLLDRAAQGMDDRDATQAGSDLATAEASLMGLRAAAPESEVLPLSERLEGLRRRLAGLPPG